MSRPIQHPTITPTPSTPYRREAAIQRCVTNSPMICSPGTDQPFCVGLRRCAATISVAPQLHRLPFLSNVPGLRGLLVGVGRGWEGGRGPMTGVAGVRWWRRRSALGATSYGCASASPPPRHRSLAVCWTMLGTRVMSGVESSRGKI